MIKSRIRACLVAIFFLPFLASCGHSMTLAKLTTNDCGQKHTIIKPQETPWVEGSVNEKRNYLEELGEVCLLRVWSNGGIYAEDGDDYVGLALKGSF